MEITKSIRKSMIVRSSGRSTDFISLSFGYNSVEYNKIYFLKTILCQRRK